MTLSGTSEGHMTLSVTSEGHVTLNATSEGLINLLNASVLLPLKLTAGSYSDPKPAA